MTAFVTSAGRLQPGAIQALQLAWCMAMARRNGPVGGEHHLLGLLHEDSEASRALKRTGRQVALVSASVWHVMDDFMGPQEIPKRGLKPAVDSILRSAMRSARRRGSQAGTVDILAALLRSDEPITFVLHRLTPNQLRKAHSTESVHADQWRLVDRPSIRPFTWDEFDQDLAAYLRAPLPSSDSFSVAIQPSIVAANALSEPLTVVKSDLARSQALAHLREAYDALASIEIGRGESLVVQTLVLPGIIFAIDALEQGRVVEDRWEQYWPRFARTVDDWSLAAQLLDIWSKEASVASLILALVVLVLDKA